jgi:hypothetical protein
MDGFWWLRTLCLGGLLGGLACIGIAVWVRREYEDPPAAFVIGIAMVILAAVVGLTWGGFSMAGVGCKGKATQMGDEYHYGLSSGCLVNDDGRWIPVDQVFNNRQEAS